MVLQDVEFQNSAGHKLVGIIRYPDMVEPRKLPAILVVHGFNENMNREWIANVANYLAPYGFVTLRFDFHGHGASEGEFEEHTITQQVDDVMSAISFLESLSQVDVSKIIVIGHDIGGDLAILAAEKDARIKGLVVWSARGNLRRHIETRLADYELRELKDKGRYRHGQFDIKVNYIDSMKEHDVEDALKNLYIPILVVHGNADLQVRAHEAKALFMIANEPKQLELVDDADHWFRQDSAREYLLETLLSWLNRWIN